jgi:hypothetical protein
VRYVHCGTSGSGPQGWTLCHADPVDSSSPLFTSAPSERSAIWAPCLVVVSSVPMPGDRDKPEAHLPSQQQPEQSLGDGLAARHRRGELGLWYSNGITEAYSWVAQAMFEGPRGGCTTESQVWATLQVVDQQPSVVRRAAAPSSARAVQALS